MFGDLGTAVRRVGTDDGAAYANAAGDRVGRHGDGVDAVVRGSLVTSQLLEVLDSTGVHAVDLPDRWPEGDVVDLDTVRRLHPGALGLPGRDVAIRIDDRSAAVISTYPLAGDHQLLVVERPEERLTPPLEGNVEAVPIRGTTGRFRPDAAEIEWVEDDRVVMVRGATLTRDELVAAAEALEPW